MNDSRFKPFTIKFQIEEKELSDELLKIAGELGESRSDRRLGAAATAREIIIRVLKAGQARKILGLEEPTTPKKK